MNALLAEQAELQEKIDAADGWELDRRSRSRWTRCAARPSTADVTNLSGGERRRVALCKLLLEKPDLLLLDEPTNHLDAESVAWLEKTLREWQGAVLVVTHDRYFLDNVTNWILESIAAAAFPTRATTPPGSTRSASACSRRSARRARASGSSRASRNGSAARPSRPPGQEQGAHHGL
jgi:ATPase subunit of ABC transporter with duplicated ATPase domains